MSKEKGKKINSKESAGRFLDHCCFGLLLANNQWLFQEDETKVHS